MNLNELQLSIQKRQEQKLPLINLSFADFTFYESPLSRRKIRNSFANIIRYPYYYPTARGEEEALQAVSEYYKKQDQEVDPGSLILTSSINQSYLYLLRLFSSDGGEILAPSPFSPMLDEVAAFLGQELKIFDLEAGNGWQVNLADLEKKLNKKTRAIFLMSPHLPTGAVQKEETLRQIMKIVKDRKIALIMDDSLSDFVFNKAKLPVLAQLAGNRQLVITLQTLANSFALPGLKLSWIQVSGPKAEAEEVLKALEMVSDTFLDLNQLSQTILPEIVKYSDRWRRKFQKAVEKNRDILVGKLSKAPRLRFHYPEGGFYTLVEVLPPTPKAQSTGTKEGKTPEESPGQTAKQPDTTPQEHVFQGGEDFAVRLLDQTGIYVHPGHYYGQQQGCYFMICFLQAPGVLRGSLKKIVKFLKPPKA